MLISCLCAVQLHAQEEPYVIVSPDFSSFPPVEGHLPAEAAAKTPPGYETHPEYGILPYNAQCINCAELIQRRGEHSRYFVGLGDEAHLFYSQAAFQPLHFADGKGNWRTIDPRFYPDPNVADVFKAPYQPAVTAFDKRQNRSSINVRNSELSFGHRTGMYWADADGKPISGSAGVPQVTYVGRDGVNQGGLWPGIDRQQLTKRNGLKVNYIIRERQQAAEAASWIVFSDTLELPKNYTASRIDDGYGRYQADIDIWHGELVLTHPQSEGGFHLGLPMIFDRSGRAFRGWYRWESISRTELVVDVFTPAHVSYREDLEFPITVDPVILGFEDTGMFQSADPFDTAVSDLTYTYIFRPPGYCPHSMTVEVEGKSVLTNVLIDLEHDARKLCDTFLNICRKEEILYEIRHDRCNVAYDSLRCDEDNALPGLCTTDSNSVPFARALNLPGMVGCVAPQCDPYFLTFELRNTQTRCDEDCDNECADMNFWAMTVMGARLIGEITADKTLICPQEPVVLTAFPDSGVLPYRYEWYELPDDNTIIRTDSQWTVFPDLPPGQATGFVTYRCRIFDACDSVLAVDQVSIQVREAPAADAGPSYTFCPGFDVQPVTLGGNPTTNPGNRTFTWTAQPASYESFLSSTTVANPVLDLPANFNDSVVFTVEVADPALACTRSSSVVVQFLAGLNPTITLDGSTSLCEGENLTLSVDQDYTSYSWSDGQTGQSIQVTQGGTYNVTVADANGCTGSAGAGVPVSFIPAIKFTVGPSDTSVELDASVRFFPIDLDTLNPRIDSFDWRPAIGLDATDVWQPLFTADDERWYYLTVHYEGCETVDSLRIPIRFPEDFFVPNVFSPNLDGANDDFYIEANKGLTVNDFMIFDRWGSKLHDDATRPWDGTFKGQPAIPGTYVYYFRVSFRGKSNSKVISGSVQLIR